MHTAQLGNTGATAQARGAGHDGLVARCHQPRQATPANGHSSSIRVGRQQSTWIVGILYQYCYGSILHQTLLVMMSNEREQIESQGHFSSARGNARPSCPDQPGRLRHHEIGRSGTPPNLCTNACHAPRQLLVALAWASADEYRQFRTPKTGQCL